jgi:hypothetical protein
MSHFTYQVQYIPDDTFWKTLTELPHPKVDYPVVISLGSRFKFVYAPYNALQLYAEFSKPDCALHYVVPPTPAAINSIGYLFAPQVGVSRRVYAAFFYGPGLAALAEVSPITLLQSPKGLRTLGGATYSNIPVTPVVIKGDDAPIHISIEGLKDTQYGFTLSEQPTAQGTSELQVVLRMPGAVSAQLNPATKLPV